MSDQAYVYNQRKNHLGIWEPVLATEEVTILSDYPYTAKLSERPANGLDIPSTNPPTIEGFTRTENSGAIAPKEFYVNYQAALLVFHSSMGGKKVNVKYWKTGSVVSAEDINTLIKRLVHKDVEPTVHDNNYEIGTIWVSSVKDNVGGSSIITRRVWFLTDVDDALGMAVWMPYDGRSINIKNSLDELTSINIYSDGRIEFIILDELAGMFNCAKDFYLFNFAGTEGFVKNTTDGRLTGGNALSILDFGITAVPPIYFDINTATIGHISSSGYHHLPSGGSSGKFLKWAPNDTGEWVNLPSAQYSAASPIYIDDGVIKHKNDPGNRHIPSGGSAGQALLWADDGQVSWATISTGTVYTAQSPIYIDDDVIKHKNDSGNKHIPSGGSSGQVLLWSSDGEAVWATISSGGDAYSAQSPIVLTDSIFSHASTPGNKHIPSGGSSGQFLSYDSSGGSGTAMWKGINTDGTLSSNSDSEIPSQKAVKTYVDNIKFSLPNPGSAGKVLASSDSSTYNPYGFIGSPPNQVVINRNDDPGVLGGRYFSFSLPQDIGTNSYVNFGMVTVSGKKYTFDSTKQVSEGIVFDSTNDFVDDRTAIKIKNISNSRTGTGISIGSIDSTTLSTEWGVVFAEGLSAYGISIGDINTAASGSGQFTKKAYGVYIGSVGNPIGTVAESAGISIGDVGSATMAIGLKIGKVISLNPYAIFTGEGNVLFSKIKELTMAASTDSTVTNYDKEGGTLTTKEALIKKHSTVINLKKAPDSTDSYSIAGINFYYGSDPVCKISTKESGIPKNRYAWPKVHSGGGLTIGMYDNSGNFSPDNYGLGSVRIDGRGSIEFTNACHIHSDFMLVNPYWNREDMLKGYTGGVAHGKFGTFQSGWTEKKTVAFSVTSTITTDVPPEDKGEAVHFNSNFTGNNHYENKSLKVVHAAPSTRYQYVGRYFTLQNSEKFIPGHIYDIRFRVRNNSTSGGKATTLIMVGKSTDDLSAWHHIWGGSEIVYNRGITKDNTWWFCHCEVPIPHSARDADSIWIGSFDSTKSQDYNITWFNIRNVTTDAAELRYPYHSSADIPGFRCCGAGSFSGDLQIGNIKISSNIDAPTSSSDGSVGDVRIVSPSTESAPTIYIKTKNNWWKTTLTLVSF